MRSCGLWLVVLAVVSGCGSERSSSRISDPVRMSAASGASHTGYVDSAIPIEEALLRFRRDLPKATRLTGGYRTREELVRAFVRAVEAQDTAALRHMVLRKDEFAWLYYPSSPLARPPYELSPALMWFQLQGESERGASRLLAERAGRPLGYSGHTCGPARAQGDIRLYPNCEIRRLVSPRDTAAERLFGLIIEYRGLHKFVGYANRLD
jgi:hypothetical protein